MVYTEITVKINKHTIQSLLDPHNDSAFIEFYTTFNLKVEKRKRCLNVTKQIERQTKSKRKQRRAAP